MADPYFKRRGAGGTGCRPDVVLGAADATERYSSEEARARKSPARDAGTVRATSRLPDKSSSWAESLLNGSVSIATGYASAGAGLSFELSVRLSPLITTGEYWPAIAVRDTKTAKAKTKSNRRQGADMAGLPSEAAGGRTANITAGLVMVEWDKQRVCNKYDGTDSSRPVERRLIVSPGDTGEAPGDLPSGFP
jgi:hypothetical protein